MTTEASTREATGGQKFDPELMAAQRMLRILGELHPTAQFRLVRYLEGRVFEAKMAAESNLLQTVCKDSDCCGPVQEDKP